MKTILAHLTGSETDETVLVSAHQIGQMIDGHLNCLHIGPDMAALISTAVSTAMAPSEDVSQALQLLKKQDQERTGLARQAFDKFRSAKDLAVADTPSAKRGISVAWHGEPGNTLDKLVSRARLNDLTVVARAAKDGIGLSLADLGLLVLQSGRPVLIAPCVPSKKIGGRIALAWKDTPEAARAVATAMPLLTRADQVVVLSANEDGSKTDECLECAENIANSLRWNGVKAEVRYIVPGGRNVPDAILGAARESDADLIVAGAYGRSRLREFVFGGFTQHVLESADLPVLLFH